MLAWIRCDGDHWKTGIDSTLTALAFEQDIEVVLVQQQGNLLPDSFRAKLAQLADSGLEELFYLDTAERTRPLLAIDSLQVTLISPAEIRKRMKKHSVVWSF